jgi:hypothetical protein
MENVKSSGFCRKKIMPLAVHLVRFMYISSGNISFEQKEYVVGYICIFSIIYGMCLPYPASMYNLCEKEEYFVQ